MNHLKSIATWVLIISMLLLTVLPSLASTNSHAPFGTNVKILADKGSDNSGSGSSSDDSDDDSNSSSSDDNSGNSSGRDPNKVEDSPFHKSDGHAYGRLDDKSERVKEQKLILSMYTTEELEHLRELGLELKNKYKNVYVLDVDHLILDGKKVKFDTPPVIKDGRLLIPVNALSKAYGAKVIWDETARTVTITKDNKTIIMTLETETMTVITTTPTGTTTETIKLDVKATSINGRTVVPIKFIVEQLGLKVQWNDDDDTIVVTDPTKQPTDGIGTTTPSGLTVQ